MFTFRGILAFLSFQKVTIYHRTGHSGSSQYTLFNKRTMTADGANAILKISGGDATGWGGGGTKIVLKNGGTLAVGARDTTTLPFDLCQGTVKFLTGCNNNDGRGMDLYGNNNWNVTAADGATAESPTVSYFTYESGAAEADRKVLLRSGAWNIDVAENAKFDVDVTVTKDDFGAGGNPGKLVKTGAGKLVLGGANTFTTGTTLSAGTISIENATALGSGALAISSGATLELNIADTASVSTAISGEGSVTKVGSGTTRLTGSNSYSGTTTINEGILDIRTARSAKIDLIADGAKLGVKLNKTTDSNNTITITGTSLADSEDFTSKVVVYAVNDDTVTLSVTAATVSSGTITITYLDTACEAEVTQATTLSAIEATVKEGGFVGYEDLTIKASNSPTITIDKNLNISSLTISGAVTLKFNTGYTITVASISASDTVTIDCSSLFKGEVKILTGAISDTSKFQTTNVDEGHSVTISSTGIIARVKDSLSRSNPVTGETTTFSHAFLGTTSDEWTEKTNWRTPDTDNVLGDYSAGSKAPGLHGSNEWTPLLFDGSLISQSADGDGYIAINTAGSTASADYVEGWNARYGLFNGAKVGVSYIAKFANAPQWIMVDKDSKLVFSAWATEGTSNGTLTNYVAATKGIEFDTAWDRSITVEYHFTGDGTVYYAAGLTKGTHNLKEAQVTLSGTAETLTCKTIAKKYLIEFGSTGTYSGYTLGTNSLVVTDADGTTLSPSTGDDVTVSDNVGTYIVATNTVGIYLKYVDRSDTWDIVDPLSATLSANTDWSSIEWTDSLGHKFTNPTGSHTYKVTAGDYTVTQDAAPATGSTIEVVSGKLALNSADAIAAYNSITIDSGAELDVTASGLTASKVTNNGTIKFTGGTAASPITITGDADFGTVELAADTYVYNTVDDNHVHKVNGAGASSHYMLSAFGFSDNSAFSNLTLVSKATGDGTYVWIERGIGSNVSLSVPENCNVKLSNSYAASFVSIDCAGTISYNSGSITLTGTTASTISGSCAAPITLATGASVAVSGTMTGTISTLSGNYVAHATSGSTTTYTGKALTDLPEIIVFSNVVQKAGSEFGSSLDFTTETFTNNYTVYGNVCGSYVTDAPVVGTIEVLTNGQYAVKCRNTGTDGTFIKAVRIQFYDESKVLKVKVNQRAWQQTTSTADAVKYDSLANKSTDTIAETVSGNGYGAMEIVAVRSNKVEGNVAGYGTKVYATIAEAQAAALADTTGDKIITMFADADASISEELKLRPCLHTVNVTPASKYEEVTSTTDNYVTTYSLQTKAMDMVSINFTASQDSYGKLGDDDEAGVWNVKGSNWNQYTPDLTNTKTLNELLAGATEATTSTITADFSGSGTYYATGVSTPSTANGRLLYGYIDDGANGSDPTTGGRAKIHNIPYTSYTVYIYVGTDQSGTDAFEPVYVNGSAYPNGSNQWGDYSSTHDTESSTVTLTRNQNYVMVEDLNTAELDVYATYHQEWSETHRTGLAAIQIVNTGVRAVARVGGVNYATLAEAIEHADPGDTITMLSPCMETVSITEGSDESMITIEDHKDSSNDLGYLTGAQINIATGVTLKMSAPGNCTWNVTGADVSSRLIVASNDGSGFGLKGGELRKLTLVVPSSGVADLWIEATDIVNSTVNLEMSKKVALSANGSYTIGNLTCEANAEICNYYPLTINQTTETTINGWFSQGGTVTLAGTAALKLSNSGNSAAFVINDGATLEFTGDGKTSGLISGAGTLKLTDSITSLSFANGFTGTVTPASDTAQLTITAYNFAAWPEDGDTAFTISQGTAVVSDTTISVGGTALTDTSTLKLTQGGKVVKATIPYAAAVGDTNYTSLDDAIVAATNSNTAISLYKAGEAEIPADMTLKVTSGLAKLTVSGAGTVVVTGTNAAKASEVNPLDLLAGLTDSAWSGTLYLVNIGDSEYNPLPFDSTIALLGNAHSTVKMTGVKGYWGNNGAITADCPYTLELEDLVSGSTVVTALINSSGWSGSVVSFKALKGTGSFVSNDSNTSTGCDFEITRFGTAADFTGVIRTTNRRVVIGDQIDTSAAAKVGMIYVQAGQTVTIVTNAEWQASGMTIAEGGTLVMQSNSVIRTGVAVTIKNNQVNMPDYHIYIYGTLEFGPDSLINGTGSSTSRTDEGRVNTVTFGENSRLVLLNGEIPADTYPQLMKCDESDALWNVTIGMYESGKFITKYYALEQMSTADRGNGVYIAPSVATVGTRNFGSITNAVNGANGAVITITAEDQAYEIGTNGTIRINPNGKAPTITTAAGYLTNTMTMSDGTVVYNTYIASVEESNTTSATPSNSGFTASDTFTCQVTSANSGFEDGSVVKVLHIDLGTDKSTGDATIPAKMRIYTNGEEYVESDTVAYTTGGMAMASDTRNKLTYTFSTEAFVTVGSSSYRVKFFNSDDTELTTPRFAMIAARTLSVIVDSKYASSSYAVASVFAGEVVSIVLPQDPASYNLKWENVGTNGTGTITYTLPTNTWTVGDCQVTLNGAPMIMTNANETSTHVVVTMVVDLSDVTTAGTIASIGVYGGNGAAQHSVDVKIDGGKIYYGYDGNNWGDGSTSTIAAGLHTITIKYYTGSSSSQVYVDGVNYINRSGVTWANGAVKPAISIGGTISGMAVKSVKVDYTTTDQDAIQNAADTVLTNSYTFCMSGRPVSSTEVAKLTLAEKRELIASSATQGNIVSLPNFTYDKEDVTSLSTALDYYKLTGSTTGGEVKPTMTSISHWTDDKSDNGVQITASTPTAYAGSAAKQVLKLSCSGKLTVRYAIAPSIASTKDASGNTVYTYQIPASAFGDSKVVKFRFEGTTDNVEEGGTYVTSAANETSTSGYLTNCVLPPICVIEIADGEDADFTADAFKTLTVTLTGTAATTPSTYELRKVDGTVIATATSVAAGTVTFADIPSGSFSNGKFVIGTSVAGTIAVSNIKWAGEVTTSTGAATAAYVPERLANMPLADNCTGWSHDGKTDRTVDRPRDSGSGCTYRIPAIAKGNGIIIAGYDTRLTYADLGKGTRINMAGNISTDNCVTWSEPTVMINVPNQGDSDASSVTRENDFGDPCLGYDAINNQFIALGITGNGIQSGGSNMDFVMWTRPATADGTWTKYGSIKEAFFNALVAAGDTRWATYTAMMPFQGPGHCCTTDRELTNEDGDVTIPKGTALIPVQVFSGGYVGVAWYTVADGVYTWHSTKMSTESGAEENCVTVLDDGSLYMISKNSGTRYAFRSTDYKTWTKVGDMSSYGGVQGSILKIGTKTTAGVTKSIYSATMPTYEGYWGTGDGSRSNITMFIGTDDSLDNRGTESATSKSGNGITWVTSASATENAPVQFQTGTTWCQGYTSQILIDQHTLGVLYESQSHIFFQKIDISAYVD